MVSLLPTVMSNVCLFRPYENRVSSASTAGTNMSLSYVGVTFYRETRSGVLLQRSSQIVHAFMAQRT